MVPHGLWLFHACALMTLLVVELFLCCCFWPNFAFTQSYAFSKLSFTLMAYSLWVAGSDVSLSYIRSRGRRASRQNIIKGVLATFLPECCCCMPNRLLSQSPGCSFIMVASMLSSVWFRVCNLPWPMKIDLLEYFKNTNQFFRVFCRENRFFKILT